jgi:uncharacterized UBP type Zn finger protein
LGVKPPCALVNAKLAGKKYFATLPNYLIINILIFALNRWLFNQLTFGILQGEQDGLNMNFQEISFA